MLVVCPNPTIDRQVFVGELLPGSVSRSHRNRSLPGGKPVDVLRAMKAHRWQPELLVLLPEQDEDWVARLAAEQIQAEVWRVPGQVRETIVVYEDSGRATVVNGPGQTVSPGDWAAFAEQVRQRATGQDWVVVSGSFPPGVTGDDVARLVSDLRAQGCRVALDCGPSWLAAALPAAPDLVTPNLAEATQALSGQAGTESVDAHAGAGQQAVQAAETLVDRGIGLAVVTAGSQGAAWAGAGGSGLVAAVPVEAVNPIGAGDAFLGGLMARLATGSSVADAVAWAVATASSAVTSWVPGLADADQVTELRRRLP